MDGLAIVLDATSHVELLKVYCSADCGLGHACFSPNGRYLLLRALGRGGPCSLWDVSDGSAVRRVRTYAAADEGAAELPLWMNACFVDDAVVAGQPDGRIVAWKTSGANGEMGEVLVEQGGSVVPLAVAGSMAGGWLAYGGVNASRPVVGQVKAFK